MSAKVLGDLEGRTRILFDLGCSLIYGLLDGQTGGKFGCGGSAGAGKRSVDGAEVEKSP